MNQDISRRLKSKAKTEKDRETVKPTVINDVLIKRYLIQYNKESNIFDKNDMPLWELTHLQLSYKNIIEIDNLQGMDRLTKLQLDNNIICKIQGLDHLVNLRWLDLSFNLIQKIENLDTLVHLTDLSVFSNRIEELSGLDALTELNVFSFGQNLVRNLDQSVDYLKGLKNKLEVLKMVDNPWSFVGQNEQDYKLYTIEALKALKYLDYELIDDQMRKLASQKHGDMNDMNTQQAVAKQDEEKVVDQMLIDAKIDCTDRMLDRVLEKDEDAKKLKLLHKFQDFWHNFDEAVSEMTSKYQTDMKNHHKEKTHIINYCQKVMREAELEAEKKSIAHISELQGLKKHKLRELENLEDKAMLIDEYEAALIKAISELYDSLMNIEMLLQDALFGANDNFKDKVRAINGSMKEKTIQFIKEVGQQCNDFHDALKVHALEEQAKAEAQISQDENFLEREMEEDQRTLYFLLLDQEELIPMLERFRETMDTYIGSKETLINKAIIHEQELTEKKVAEHQHSRNRGIVKEIVDTCDSFQKEIKEDFTLLRGEDED